jgi:hypothetical protein
MSKLTLMTEDVGVAAQLCLWAFFHHLLLLGLFLVPKRVQERRPVMQSNNHLLVMGEM